MQRRRLGLLVNPAAGRGRAARVGPLALEQLRQAGYDVDDLTARDLETARRGAATFLTETDDGGRGGAGDPVDRALVAVGGDGVVNLAVNAILTHAPHVPLAVIPAGTGNDAARALGIDARDPLAAIARTIAQLALPTRAIDVGEILDPVVEQGAPSVHRYFVTAAGAGIDAAVNARANRISWPRGPARYVVALVRELVAFRGYATRVTADGVVLDAGTLLAVANGPSIGGGMRIAPDADLADGLLDVVTAPRIPRRTLLRIFPRVYAGRHVTHPAVTVTRAREVLVAAGTGAGAPTPLVHADGEPIGRAPLRLRVVPQALHVLA